MLKQWLISLVFACVAGALVSIISPQGNAEKTLKTVVGIFIIAAICAPLSELDNNGLSLPAFSPENYEQDENDLNDYVVKSFESEIEKRISEIIREHNLSVDEIKVKAESGNDCIIIRDVVINIQNDEYETAEYAARIINDELGIPVTLTE